MNIPNINPPGPGGRLVDALGGINSLANDMDLRQINHIKAQYAPLTTQAEAASKLAYANLMGPQFLAKMLGNEGIVANLSPEQLQNALATTYSAGSGGGSGFNILNQLQQGNQPSNNSFSGWAQDQLRNRLSPTPSANVLNESNDALAPGQDPVEYVRKNNIHSPEYQPPQSQQIALPPLPNKGGSYSSNLGDYKADVKQREEQGKYRAEALRDIGKSQLALSKAGDSLNRLTDIVTNPTFVNMRNKIPLFQDYQIMALEKLGTKEEQRLIGDFYNTAESVVGATVQAFEGKPLVTEFDLARQQKVNKNDTMGVIEGKMMASLALKEIGDKKMQLIGDMLRKGYDEDQAVTYANKAIDTRAIEKQIKSKFETAKPNISEDHIKWMAKKNGLTVEQAKEKLKAKGLL